MTDYLFLDNMKTTLPNETNKDKPYIIRSSSLKRYQALYLSGISLALISSDRVGGVDP